MGDFSELSFEYVHVVDNYYHSCDFQTSGATRERSGRVGAGANTDAKCNGAGHTFVKAIICRNFGCRDQKMDSSSALESYGSLLSNAPSLATIV